MLAQPWKPLTMCIYNSNKANAVRAAIDMAKQERYGLYKLRLCLFDVLKGTLLEAAWVAEKLLPRSGKLDDESLKMISMLPEWIDAAEDESLCGVRKVIEMALLICSRA